MRRLLPLVLLFAACAGGAGGKESADMAGANSDAGSSSDLGLECSLVTVFPVNGVAPVTLTAVATSGSAGTPMWTAFTPSGTVTPTALDGSGLSVSLLATQPGTYSFHVTFAGSADCEGDNSVQVAAPDAAQVSYRLRLTPPASSGLPQQDSVITVQGGTPQADADVLLTAGTALGGVMRGPAGAIAGQVQLLPQNGPQLVMAVDASGSFSLPIQPDATYRLALIPSDATLAPRLLGPSDGVSLLAASFALDTGVGVSGLVRDPSASPLVGASVVLRAGVLPSGLGTSAADGSYALRVEPGTVSLAASTPGWPDVLLDGVTIGASGATLGIDQLLARQSVTLAVVRADGTTAVVGAQLTLKSRALASAANVTVDGVTQAASGVMRANGASGAGGALATLLTAGTYDVLVTPPAGLSEGPTGLAVAIAGGSITLTLAAPVPLVGAVRDTRGAAVAGAAVHVLAADGTLLATATTDASGAFTVALSAGVPVDLEVDPPAGASLASTRMHLGATDGTLGAPLPSSVAISLRPGLAIGGIVRGPSAAPLGEVTVDLLCLSCGDPTPLASAQANAGGVYNLSVPDPGSLEVDAGDDGP